MKELLNIEKKRLDNEVDKRRVKHKMWEIEDKQRENENDNLKMRIVKEKVEFE
jgi:hypothetical protein